MTDLTARKKMLDTLSDDLVYEGWDLPCKLWMVLGSNEDPYLEFVGNYNMDPNHWWMHRAEEGSVKDHVIGLVTCWESWCYPKALGDYFDQHREKGGVALQAYSAIIGPQGHPDHGNLRSMMAVFRDGEVIKVEHFDTGEKKFNAMSDHPLTGSVGDELVDYMRCVIGIHSYDPNPLHRISELFTNSAKIQSIIDTAKRENWPSVRLSAEIFKHAPEDVQQELARTMPEEVRRYLDAESHPQP